MIERIRSVIETLLVVTFTMMLLIGLLQIANRYLIGWPINWTEEAQRYLHVWLVFLALPVGYLTRAHISLEAFDFERWPRFARWLDMFIDLLWLVLGGALVWAGSLVARVAHTQTSPGLQIPMSLAYFALIFGGVILSIFSVRKLTVNKRDKE
ncbi:MAG: hypothetical protein Hens3KO_18170 [Henriciella sp.]